MVTYAVFVLLSVIFSIGLFGPNESGNMDLNVATMLMFALAEMSCFIQKDVHIISAFIRYSPLKIFAAPVVEIVAVGAVNAVGEEVLIAADVDVIVVAAIALVAVATSVGTCLKKDWICSFSFLCFVCLAESICLKSEDVDRVQSENSVLHHMHPAV